MRKLVVLTENFTAVLIDETRRHHYSNSQIEKIWNLSDLEVQAIKRMDSNERLYVYNVMNETTDQICVPHTLHIEEEITMSDNVRRLESLHLSLAYCEVEIIDL